MRVCFLCSTPFQVFSAINIKNCYFRDELVDIYVYDYFKDSDKLSIKLKESSLFNYVIDCKYKTIHSQLVNNRGLRAIYRKFQFYKWNRGYITKVLDKCVYDNVFYSNQDPINEIIVSELFTRNQSIIINHFEDGWVDYVFPYKYFYGERTRISNRFWKTPEEYFTRKTSYLYSPELAEAFKQNKSINRITIDSRNTLLYTNPIFNYTKDAFIPGNVLYFDTLAENKLGISSKDHLKVLDCCSAKIPLDNIIVKKHPRNFSTYYEDSGYNVYKYQSIPFEIICANQNFENSLLISSFSTACFSPNILFGQEPFIILTFKLTGLDSEMDDKTSNFLERICKNFSDNKKIMIPESYEKLEQCIEFYTRCVKNEEN